MDKLDGVLIDTDVLVVGAGAGGLIEVHPLIPAQAGIQHHSNRPPCRPGSRLCEDGRNGFCYEWA